MPYTVNGIGTGLVRASRKRTVEEYTQFDAVEAFVLLYIPLVPYKVIHILSIWPGSEGEQYQSMPLQFAPKIVAKAFLNGWGNVLLWLCTPMAAVFTVVTFTMEREVNDTDVACLTVLWTLAFVGLCLKTIWCFWSGRDERIVETIGSHEFGTSDPFYWQDQLLAEVAEATLKDLSENRLIDRAQACFREGDAASALYLARIAMRTENRTEAEAISAQILATNR